MTIIKVIQFVVIAVLVTFFIAVPLLAVFFGATGYLVNTLTAGYVSRELSMWVISTIVLFYVTRGGFKSIVSVGVASVLALFFYYIYFRNYCLFFCRRY